CSSNPAPVVEVSSRNPIGDRRVRLLEESLDLVTQLVRHAFVGVNYQNPVCRGLVHCEVLLRAVPRPRTHKHFGRIGLHQLDRPVRALSINNDDLVHPLQGLQASAYIRLLVFSNGNGSYSHSRYLNDHGSMSVLPKDCLAVCEMLA